MPSNSKAVPRTDAVAVLLKPVETMSPGWTLSPIRAGFQSEPGTWYSTLPLTSENTAEASSAVAAAIPRNAKERKMAINESSAPR
ncbi:MAG TPA: hypothetical protein VMV83_00580 [Rectinemataceae bacterium]|nr:hypothetical protein [Rectinemataceae bacterium]